MTTLCRLCGSTESQAVANAQVLGLEQELESGIHTCCQIREWAREQLLAWSEAAQEDNKSPHDGAKLPESEEAEAVLVPVRVRRPQIGAVRGPAHRGKRSDSSCPETPYIWKRPTGPKIC